MRVSADVFWYALAYLAYGKGATAHRRQNPVVFQWSFASSYLSFCWPSMKKRLRCDEGVRQLMMDSRVAAETEPVTIAVTRLSRISGDMNE